LLSVGASIRPGDRFEGRALPPVIVPTLTPGHSNPPGSPNLACSIPMVHTWRDKLNETDGSRPSSVYGTVMTKGRSRGRPGEEAISLSRTGLTAFGVNAVDSICSATVRRVGKETGISMESLLSSAWWSRHLLDVALQQSLALYLYLDPPPHTAPICGPLLQRYRWQDPFLWWSSTGTGSL
jgi:hypothetical protein